MKMKYSWLFPHFLTILGFILAFVLLLNLLRERRSPSTTIAWLLAIFLVPYVGVPLYIMFGGRKMKKMAGKKAMMPLPEKDSSSSTTDHRPFIRETRDVPFPLRNGNSVEQILTGEDAYWRLMTALKNAQKSIFITTFILGKDATGTAIVNLLAQKAREGVDVCLLLDALGSRTITDRFLADFTQAGGKHAFFMHMLHLPFRGRANLRNHRKIVIIDSETAILGGMNLASEYMGGQKDSRRWQDLSISVQGPIVDDLATVFYSDWQFATQMDIAVESNAQEMVNTDDAVSLQLVPSGPDVNGDPLYEMILASIFAARKRIWIVTPYFIPDEMLLKALGIAARQNVDVRIIVPLMSNHRLADLIRRTYLRQLEADGVKIYQFRPGMLHGKLILIDDSTGITGSANMDMRSMFLNYEIAVFIYSDNQIRRLDEWVERLMRESDVTLKKASVFVDYLEGIARLLSPLL